MSIASELNRLLQAKSDLATSITNKGVTVPSATTIDGYAALVDQIQQGGGTLPYDAEIEYLQSSGTQYINTGITYNSNNEYNVYCELIYTTSISDNKYYMNGWNAGGAFGVINNRCTDGSNTSIMTNVINKNLSINMRINAGTSTQTITYIIEGDNQNMATRGHASLATYASNSGFMIFGCVSKGAMQYYVDEKIYRFKMEVNKTLVRDFIPVRVGQVGYMYDKVSGELFGNVGTDSFTLGPDVT